VAIRRCPYCKAIIDESQKYCNNCGTQLLFPEDEFVEEETKGEKITDEDFKDASEEEFEESLEAPDDKEESGKEIDLEDVIGGETLLPGEEKSLSGEEESEQALEDIMPPAEAELAESPGIEEKESLAKEDRADEMKAETAADVSGKGPEQTREEEPFAEEKIPQIEKARAELDTKDEIALLIAAFEEKRKTGEKILGEKKISEPVEKTDELPPWAAKAEDEAVSQARAIEAGEDKKPMGIASDVAGDFEDEVPSVQETAPRPRTTIGIPEAAASEEGSLRFEREAEIFKPAESGLEEAREIETRVPGIEKPRRKIGFLGRIKAILLDLVFVLILWLVAVWLAARLMAVSLLVLIAASAVPLALFYVILFSSYAFLFFFFLGDTLGGRMASPRD
jgi:hypothetical protein